MIEVCLRHHLPGFVLDVAFHTTAGVTVLFGPSGAGKSLTLRAIAGLFRPHAGRVVVQGDTWLDTQQNVWIPPQRRKVGYVPQHYGLFPHLTVRENIAFGLRRWPSHQRTARVEELLTVMHLRELANRYPRELSGGQQQRVALARALAPRPHVLLLDEALGALDPVLREQLREEVRQIQRRYAIPVILITHDVHEMAAMADKVVAMHHGRVIQVAPPEEIFRRPATPALARAVGMRNLLTGTIRHHTEDITEIVWAGGTLKVPRVPYPPHTPVQFGIRPEDVVFVREDRPLKAAHNVLTTVIVGVHPAAFDYIITLQLVNNASVHLYARLPHPLVHELHLRPGQQRRILLRRRAIHIFPPVEEARSSKEEGAS